MCLANAQPPQGIKYQAVLRGKDGKPWINKSVGVDLSIIEGNPNGQVIYKEEHGLLTNEFGLIQFVIGQGYRRTKTKFDEIIWGANDYFMKLEVDFEGNSKYVDIGTTQFLSVPYALFAGNARLVSPIGTEFTLAVDEDGSLKTEQIYGTVTDSEGHIYKTVKIAGQWWMAENLNIGERIHGYWGGDMHDGMQIDNKEIEKYCYDNNEANCDTFGGLYTLYEAVNYFENYPQGICPDGWHIPNTREWNNLIDTLGGFRKAGKELKVGGISGMNMMYSGQYVNKHFTFKGGVAIYWSIDESIEETADFIHLKTLHSDDDGFFESGSITSTCEQIGYSIRCVKDSIK